MQQNYNLCNILTVSILKFLGLKRGGFQITKWLLSSDHNLEGDLASVTSVINYLDFSMGGAAAAKSVINLSNFIT